VSVHSAANAHITQQYHDFMTVGITFITGVPILITRECHFMTVYTGFITNINEFITPVCKLVTPTLDCSTRNSLS